MDIPDVKSLRLTCRASNEILAAQVLHSITINMKKSSLDEDMHKLQCWATEPCACATSHATHELTIKSLSPGYDPSRRLWFVGDDDINNFEVSTLETEPQPSAETLLVEDEMKKFLFDALSSFQNVQSVLYVIFHAVYSLLKIVFRYYLIVDGSLSWTTELGFRPLSWMP